MNRRDFLKLGITTGVLSPLAAGSVADAAASGTATGERVGIEIIALNRIGFGPRPGDLDAFRELGRDPGSRLQNHVERQLHPEAIDDSVCDHRIADAHYETLAKTLPELWKDHVLAANQIRDAMKEAKAQAVDPRAPLPPGQAPPPATGAAQAQPAMVDDDPKAKRRDENQLRLLPAREVEGATWIRAVYSARQLNEILVNFWHDHFNVYAGDNQTGPVFSHYDREVIRAHAFGNFRLMLEAVGKSPAMLYYLDNFINQSGNPNENYARELFELHALGAENYYGTQARAKVPGAAQNAPAGYVDGDVYEAARCFTGWRVANGKENTPDSGEFIYFDQWHDRFQKVVLGRHLPEYQPPMKDGEDVLDMLALHPGTARYISRKLCRRFISDEPSESIVRSAAQVFSANATQGDQLRRVLRHILTSREFQGSWQHKIKRPFEYVASLLRATSAEFWPTEQFVNQFNRTGERPFQWRTPDGYPDSRLRWGSSSSMLGRFQLANIYLNGDCDGVKIRLASSVDPKAQAISLANEYLGRPIGASSRRALEEAAASLHGDSAPALAALVFMSPEFQYK